MIDVFRYFLRKNFSSAASKLSDEDIDNLGEEFHKHLDRLLNEDQKEKILPKGKNHPIMNIGNPLIKSGFHPAYILHFTQWIKEQKDKTE